MATKWIKYGVVALLGAAVVVLLTKKSDVIKDGYNDLMDHAHDLKKKVTRKAEDVIDDLEDLADDARKEIKKRQKAACDLKL